MSFLDFPDADPKRRARRPLLIFLIISLGAGAIGSAVTTPAIPAWYASLARPSFTPPDWLFAPVWTTLYVLMAVAAWRVWRKRGTSSAAIRLWAAQLLLNLAWSFLFFGLHRIGWALIELIVLWLAVLATAVVFFRADRLAALLLLPYLLWVGFAGALNHGFWLLNG
jgi:tryptophan-rich sensory protein